jgi:hypothetical protein
MALHHQAKDDYFQFSLEKHQVIYLVVTLEKFCTTHCLT